MRLNLAVIVLAVIMGGVIFFLYAITPKPKTPQPIDNTNTVVTTPEPKSYAAAPKALTPAQQQRVRDHAQDWSVQPTYSYGFNALDPAYAVTQISNSLFDPTDDYWGLPRDDKGTFELVEAYCTSCHNLSIVMQQRATPQRWEELLVWMEEKQGMAALPAEDERPVLDYLGTYFSTVQ